MASVPDTCDIGLIGLAVMGENLVLNMESKGFTVAVYNRTNAVTEKFGGKPRRRQKHQADAHPWRSSSSRSSVPARR